MNLKDIFLRFKFKISLTLLVVICEGILFILFPLFIGNAIESGINKTYDGIIQLAILCTIVLVIGSVRRMYDTRVYAGIYQHLAEHLAVNRKINDTSGSVAHVNLLEEVVDFFEESLPELIGNIIGLVGTLILVFSLNKIVFVLCIFAAVLIFIIYALSANKTLFLNKSYNNEYEQQVNVHSQQNIKEKAKHYKKLMMWKIRLSDLETINFAGVWIILSIVLCLSVHFVVDAKGIVFGVLFSTIMYVYQFIENAVNLPFYYQQSLRLKDISNRINDSLK